MRQRQRQRQRRQLLTDHLYQHAYPWQSLHRVVQDGGNAVSAGGRRQDGTRFLVVVQERACEETAELPCRSCAVGAWHAVHGWDAPEPVFRLVGPRWLVAEEGR